MLWGSWLLVTGLVFTSAGDLPPLLHRCARAGRWCTGGDRGGHAVAAAQRSGPGWRSRRPWRHVLWSHHLLARSPSWHPWLRALVLVIGLLAAGLPGATRCAVIPVAAGRPLGCDAALGVALAGPLSTRSTRPPARSQGAIPTAGPGVVGAAFGGPGGARPGGGGAGGGAGGSALRRLWWPARWPQVAAVAVVCSTPAP